MHHLILNVAPRGRGGGDIDHINGDGLDNRRANLRRATRRQNIANSGSRVDTTSRFKGVSWSEHAQAWQVHIRLERKSKYLGLYEHEDEAALVYDSVAHETYGEFARLNLPDRLGEPLPGRYSALARPRDLTGKASPVTAVVGPEDHRWGARNPNAKLTEDDVRQIIAELQEVPRRSYRQIAERFGVSAGQVSHIANRRSWAHLW